FEPAGYSENFLMYTDDVDGDGHHDILVLGFPGKESWWYQNPGEAAREKLWTRHTMLAVTDNESPMIADIDGDGVRDLVCCSEGYYGYATHAGQSPTDLWRFVRISPNNNYHRFTHGLGVGDVNNDGHQDLLEKDGWWQNPGEPVSPAATSQAWTFHAFAFAEGGSQMYALDLDGDGRNEVLTGLAAHGFGLVYYRALNDEATQFERVDIMSDDPATSPVGLAVSQLHAVEIADINGDGLTDIVTGKRWWAHANHDPGNSQPATLLWLETQRGEGGRVRFIPHVIDNSSGVGTQVTVGDVNGDGLQDIVSGIKRGAYLFLQRPADLPATKSMLPELAAADRFDQRPARQSVRVESSTGIYFLPLKGRAVLNFDFENDKLLDWEMRGPMAASALAGLSQGSGFTGEFAIDTGSNDPGLVGELISRAFELSHPKLTFLLSGQADPEARVELVDEATGLVLQAIEPQSTDKPQLETFDCSAHQGKLVRIRVIDHSDKGYLRVDDFRFID
ncbi:MAG: VCBS repeat-containing protein, partial [Aureliella sp.]